MAANKISLTNATAETNHLTLSIAKATTIKISGAALQTQTNAASGYFTNASQSGTFNLLPQ